MAADVLMGNDAGRAALDPRASASHPPRARTAGARTGDGRRRRRPRRDRPDRVARPPRRLGKAPMMQAEDTARHATATDRSSSSRRRAGAAGSRPGRRSSTRRARSASTSTPCAAGAGICGRCQVVPAEGSFPKHGIESRADHLSPPGAVEAEYERVRGARRGPPALAVPRSRRRRRRRRAAREPGPPPGRPQGHRPSRDFEIDPVVRLHYVEVERPELEPARRRPRPALRGARARVGADRPRGRPRRRSGRSSRPSSRGRLQA